MGLEEFTSDTDDTTTGRNRGSQPDETDSYSQEDDLILRIEGYCKQLANRDEYVEPEAIADRLGEDPADIESALSSHEDFIQKDGNEENPVFENPFCVLED